MGRTQPSRGLAPPSQRKDARARYARQTVNKTLPALLASTPRARRGVESAELIVAPLAAARRDEEKVEQGGGNTQEAGSRQLNIRLMNADTLSVASSLCATQGKHDRRSKNPRNVAVLNMASPLRPGGGLLNGAVAQEESLCLRTTLYPSLKDEWYRLPELGVVWTADVMVFRDEEGRELRKAERWWVDVVSAGALRFPELDVSEDADVRGEEEQDSDGVVGSEDEDNTEATKVDKPSSRGADTYSNAADRKMVEAKMRAVLRVLGEKGSKHIVLGAWGCGAYGNPVGEIAHAWRRVLLNELSSYNPRKRASGKEREPWDFEEVVFAISEKRMARDFAKAFGADMVVEEQAPQGEVGDDVDGGQDGISQELEVKIQELEAQLQRVLNPGLKERLQSVLQGLRSQQEISAKPNSDSDNDKENG